MNEAQRKHDFLAGQMDAQRTALIALALSLPIRSQFLQLYTALQASQQELLLATTHTDPFLEGMRCEHEAIASMIQRDVF